MAELRTFLFTDICRSVDLKNEMPGANATERDQAFITAILTPHRQRIEANLAAQQGRIVSTAGDGHFLVFDDAIRAAQWAVDVQRSHHDDPIETPGGGRVEVRISMHVGVPQVDPRDPDNFVGKSVDYAARLNDYATGGQIVVSRSVMALLDDIGLEGISFHAHGPRPLKGIGQVEVYEMLYGGRPPRPLRQRPQAPPKREWTVIPTVGFEGAPADAGSSGGGTSALSHATLQRVGKYLLEERLGSGGMGDVYKGRHVQFNRIRAIKVIKPQFIATDNRQIIRRFYREIKAIGALEHPNIVVAIDSSSPEDRIHYLVMEYVEGVSLYDLVEAHGPLSAADAAEIIRQAALGLQYIHRHGMVHRDIKPSNLMLTAVEGHATDPGAAASAAPSVRGVVKILDLGLALLADDPQDRLTQHDAKAMGTEMYMSPEQWRTSSVDIRADIYSLGCTLYHLLAGKPPFADSDLRPEKAHAKSRLPPIRGGTRVPSKLWDVLCRMLAKRPEERFATPAEVAEALAPLAAGSDLVGVLRDYDNSNFVTRRPTETEVDSAAAKDTWRSRASHFYPSRRWLLTRGLPFLLIATTIGGLLWALNDLRNRALKKAEEKARQYLPFIARQAVIDHLGEEITTRFDILQRAAADEAMIAMVRDFDPSQGREAAAKHPLQTWIGNQRTKYSHANSDSWFINDRSGIQIARSPLLEKSDGGYALVHSLLNNYAYRNYFHGEEKDRDKADPGPVEPIRQPHISAVYISSTSGKMKVAFSVPIRSAPGAGEPREVIGVLSMSVDLGEFEILDGKYREGKTVVLVDTRKDYLDAKVGGPALFARRGMILDHPKLSLWKPNQGRPRVDQRVLDAMLAAKSAGGSGEGFVSGYYDPFEPGRTFWGAFAPVTYSLTIDRERTIDSGWMVLVQEVASY